ncbi:Amino acid transporter ANT1 [Dichanthelium oligosanthes]|uniref:Amino acid transporter ANT1 n=1 Tax=Dichanthelium oligosanthes TaxID=888268 RepID=A0A1E5W2C4_9POAL|nr:Amino acid transporter ANT1 [Dichanthelium oligosanthes]
MAGAKAAADGSATQPLLAQEEGSTRTRGGGGGATPAQTLGNVVVSIVGTGVLGLPYAFRAAGWLAGSLGVAAAGSATLYCMLLLVDCRDKLEEDETEECCHGHYTYGDLGERCFGTIGRCLTEILILVSQAGGSVAYLIFIGQNLHSIFSQLMSPAGFIFAILLPVQIALSFIRSLSSLSTFSIFADVCNVLAMAIVIKQDLQLFDHPFANRSAFNGLWAVPFTFGIAVFCFEGFSMTLALEASMAERRKFRWVLSQAVAAIITVYVCFGVCGYLAYGEATKDIITLNLPNNWLSAAVKVGLCIALAFTFPIMMHPIHEIVETRFTSSGCFQKLSRNIRGAEWLGLHSSRVLVVTILTVVASFIPAFGSFISFVGSTMCALLSFVLPALFHLSIVGSSMSLWRWVLDYGILLFGLAFAGNGLVTALSSH